MTQSAKTPRIVGRVVGGLFIATGFFKLLAPAAPGFAGGARGFGHALGTLGVPLPLLFGWGVPLLEVGGGLALLVAHRPLWRVVVAALLALDMMAAIGLVGVPGRMGHPLKVGDHEIGREAWRLPLEVVLLGACLYLLERSLRATKVHRL